jgi:hypothetical protein
MELQPGATAPLHTHEYSYVFTVLVRVLNWRTRREWLAIAIGIWRSPASAEHIHPNQPPPKKTQNGSTMAVHDEAGALLMTFTAKSGETLAFDLVGDDLVTPDGTHRITKTHR